MPSFLQKTFCASLVLLVASFGASHAQNAAPASADPAGLASKFSYHLVKLDKGQLKPVETASLNGVKYFAFYYSASWCPPCRAFTPKLVEFYNEFKPQHPNFELIFVNHDNSEDDMLAYMKTDSMQWPAVRFDDIDSTKANQFCGDGIPDLVLVDASGKVKDVKLVESSGYADLDSASVRTIKRCVFKNGVASTSASSNAAWESVKVSWVLK